MVLYPVSALRAALRAVQETFADILQKGHQRDRIPDMLTRAELYDLLGYENYEARDRSYFR
jgi:methylisocitrate lyase